MTDAEDNPFDLDVTGAAAPATDAAEKQAEPETEKPKRTRRTKAEIEAEKADKADKSAAKAEKEPKKLSESYNLGDTFSAEAGDLIGGIKPHNGVAVAYAQPKGWIGPEALIIGLDQLSDLKEIVDSLVEQVSA